MVSSVDEALRVVIEARARGYREGSVNALRLRLLGDRSCDGGVASLGWSQCSSRRSSPSRLRFSRTTGPECPTWGTSRASGGT